MDFANWAGSAVQNNPKKIKNVNFAYVNRFESSTPKFIGGMRVLQDVIIEFRELVGVEGSK